MPKFMVERDLPGAAELSGDELRTVAGKSNDVLEAMSPRAQWLESYVTEDRFFCIYVAADQEAIREHAARGGFPITAIREIRRVIDPTTAEVGS